MLVKPATPAHGSEEPGPGARLPRTRKAHYGYLFTFQSALKQEVWDGYFRRSLEPHSRLLPDWLAARVTEPQATQSLSSWVRPTGPHLYPQNAHCQAFIRQILEICAIPQNTQTGRLR